MGNTTATYYIRRFVLHYWACDEKYFKKEKKKFNDKYKKIIARIELLPHSELNTRDYKIPVKSSDKEKSIQDSIDYCNERNLFNWGPGILKNYIQNIMVKLERGEKNTMVDEYLNPLKIKELKNKVLYIPRYLLVSFDFYSFSYRGGEKKFQKDYPYPFEVISKKDLNNKIIYDNASFYYLIFIKNLTHKYFYIIDSSTGEIILMRNKRSNYFFSHFTKGDLQNIIKAIH